MSVTQSCVLMAWVSWLWDRVTWSVARQFVLDQDLWIISWGWRDKIRYQEVLSKVPCRTWVWAFRPVSAWPEQAARVG